MYKGFYGLTDSPFSIAPNPEFLFPSERHKEALAHLTYGLGENGGFVLLTGEVGTGKTTVSRCLLSELPDTTDLAYVLNPALSELELLATLCDELEIDYPEGPTLKQLTDRISAFLLANHKKGRQTLLLIDEAQHLRPETLEQLRLLTNLETDTRKLLQVILIGQPELQMLLRRQELRQLAQRITARYHLLPLTPMEVESYVLHRLRVAGRVQPLFKPSAIKALAKYSGGVPRLINLICERALMGGFGAQKNLLDGGDVYQAAIEVIDDVKPQRKSAWVWVASLLLAVSGFAGAHFYLSNQPTKAQPEINIEHLLNHQGQQLIAFQALFHHWHQPIPAESPCEFANQHQLACSAQQGDWSTLVERDRPAVAKFSDEQHSFYAAVLGLSEDEVLIQLGEQQLWIQSSWLATRFDGEFTLLWQPPASLPDKVDENSAPAQWQWLENRLARVQHRSARLTQSFDERLSSALKAFQTEQGLTVSGEAEMETLERLVLLNSNVGPRLREVY